MTFNGHAAAVQSMLRRPVVALLAGVCLHASQAAGEDAIDCASINLGRLDVALASDSSTVRTVAMQAGDTLTFTGRVVEVVEQAGETRHVVEVVGTVPSGAHVTARVVVSGVEASEGVSA